jgi:hypothetical protein
MKKDAKETPHIYERTATINGKEILNLSPGAILLLLHLRLNHSEDPVFQFSPKLTAILLGKNVSTVRQYRDELVKLGSIHQIRRGGHSVGQRGLYTFSERIYALYLTHQKEKRNEDDQLRRRLEGLRKRSPNYAKA